MSSPDPSPAPVASPDVGAALAAARERRGISLAEAATATRIAETYLRDLEAGASIQSFPAPAYARFFLREYARYLGLDDEPLVSAFEERVRALEERPLDLARPTVPRRGRVLARLLVVGSSAALVAVAVLSLLPEQREERGGRADAPAPAATTPPLQPEPSPTASPSRQAAPGLRAVLRVEDRSWVQAVADGEGAVAETFEPGRRVVLRARRSLELTLGNAGGVRLRVNGERVGTGGSGEVVHLVLEWKKGRAVISRPPGSSAP